VRGNEEEDCSGCCTASESLSTTVHLWHSDDLLVPELDDEMRLFYEPLPYLNRFLDAAGIMVNAERPVNLCLGSVTSERHPRGA
jgi:hypothetical protein